MNIAEQYPPKRLAAELATLAAPIIGVMLSRTVISFTDFAMVSRLGTDEQAAIGPASVLVFSVLCIGMGIASSVQTFASQSIGRGDAPAASAYAWQGFYVALALSALVLPLIPLTPALYGWIGGVAQHSQRVLEFEIAYSRPALWAFLPSMLCSALESYFNGIHRPRIGLLSILIAVIFNFFANYALIFGHWGFPAMGIAGAAWASVISWWLRTLILGIAFLSPIFNDTFRTREGWPFSWKKTVGLFRIGSPASIQWVVDLGSWVVFMNMLIPPLGKTAMAASNVGLQYMHLSFMPAVGIGMAVTSQVGKAIGEKNKDLAALRAGMALRLTMAFMTCIAVLFILGGERLMGWMSDDPEVIAAGRLVLLWCAVFQVFDSYGIVYGYALRGAGDTRWPAIAVMICCWGIFIGGGWAVTRLAPGWGLHGPWLMCAVYISVLGVALGWRFRSGAWRRIELLDDGPPLPIEPPAITPPEIAARLD